MNLLSYLASYLDCQYISDLHYICITQGQANHIRAIPEDRFSLKEYNIAAQYIAGAGGDFPTIAQASAAIVQALLTQQDESSVF
ncbi:MAG: hypothetical protein PHO66_09025 [Eubacteriales bacterium]|nr:hypothetical protein [Eubacteriales bacterium]